MQRNKLYQIVVVLTTGTRLEFSTDSKPVFDEMMTSLMSRDTWVIFPPQGDNQHTINTNQIAELIHGEWPQNVA